MKRRFSAQIDQLRPMLEWVLSQLLSMEFDPPTLRKIELASEEALVNVMQHAYSNKPGQVEVEVKLYSKSHIEIVVKDRGRPFTPLEIKAIDPAQPLEEREIGGLGLFFIHQCMDEVKYDREGDENILIMKKKIPNRSSRKK